MSNKKGLTATINGQKFYSMDELQAWDELEAYCKEENDITSWSKNKNSMFSGFLKKSDQEILKELKTRDFWSANPNIHSSSLMARLCEHPNALESLSFLSSQTSNFSWRTNDMVAVGVALEQLKPTQRVRVFQGLFGAHSTIDARNMLLTLLDFDIGQDKVTGEAVFADETIELLFQHTLQEGGVEDLFAKELPESLHGVWFVCQKLEQYPNTHFSLNQEVFDAGILSIGCLAPKEREIKGSQTWFLKAWGKIEGKGAKLYHVYNDALYGRSDSTEVLERVVDMLNDDDIALFVEKQLTDLAPGLGARTRSILERGILREELKDAVDRNHDGILKRKM